MEWSKGLVDRATPLLIRRSICASERRKIVSLKGRYRVSSSFFGNAQFYLQLYET